MPESAYGNSREIADDLLTDLNVEVESYDPMIGAGIAKLIRPNTSSHLDRKPRLDHDGSARHRPRSSPPPARTKSPSRSTTPTPPASCSTLLPTASTSACKPSPSTSAATATSCSAPSRSATKPPCAQVGKIYRLLGLAVSPDDCSLALRGLTTLGVRLAQLEQSALTIANWLKARPEIALVLHPALPDCPGHDIWKRDFTGSASVFSIVFNDIVDRRPHREIRRCPAPLQNRLQLGRRG